MTERMELNREQSDRGKAEGIARVANAARDEWVRDAKTALLRLATEMPEFTTDDLWRTGLPKPAEARALGPIMAWAARSGYIEDTHRSVNTAQVRSHSAPIRIWRSRLIA